jgi:hypothetical protein
MNKNFSFLYISKITGLKVCICFFSAILILSCNKDAIVNNVNQDCSNQPPSTLIKGEWELISQKPYWNPTVVWTPDSAGYTMYLKLTDDSAYSYKDDSLQYSFHYSLGFKKDFPNPGDSTLMFFAGNQSDLNTSTFFFKVSCDTLILNDTYVDGALSIYKRN